MVRDAHERDVAFARLIREVGRLEDAVLRMARADAGSEQDRAAIADARAGAERLIGALDDYRDTFWPAGGG